jgi:hypothetical protein
MTSMEITVTLDTFKETPSFWVPLGLSASRSTVKAPVLFTRNGHFPDEADEADEAADSKHSREKSVARTHQES